MKFVSIRDFGNKAAAIHKALKTEHEIVLTCNGKPFAILVEADEDTFEEKLAVLRRSRARAVLDRNPPVRLPVPLPQAVEASAQCA